ncbi:MAG TPA: MAPEG family protein [Croceibacterium sp.]|nr:MAPEG family protein [Croceibacterium sp.]
MRKEQKIVAIGAASGIAAMLAGMFGLSSLMPALPVTADAGERLAFAAQWTALAALPLFLAITAVGNARFKSDAIDPTAGKDDRAMIINGRMVDNTLQQFALFVSASFAVAASAAGNALNVIAMGAIIFVVARLAFWVGYRVDPLYRAFGMAATSYLNVVLFGTAIWQAWQ